VSLDQATAAEIARDVRKLLESAGVGYVDFLAVVLPVVVQESAEQARAVDMTALNRRITGDNQARRRRVALEEDPWLTAAEAADYLGLTYMALKRRIQRGQIKADRMGQRRWRIRKSTCDQVMQAAENRASRRRGPTSTSAVPARRAAGGAGGRGVRPNSR
jgi:excisionase family DNA binding protein